MNKTDSKCMEIFSAFFILYDTDKENVWHRTDEVTNEWSKLHSRKLYNLYCSRKVIRLILPMIKWVRRTSCTEENKQNHETHMGLKIS
jgi:hypothetical protein